MTNVLRARVAISCLYFFILVEYLGITFLEVPSTVLILQR